MAKSYLVTGGSGFIGAALVRRLVARGDRVRVLDNLSRGNQRRLVDVARDVEFVEADIRDAAAADQAAQGIDCVCHAAFVNGTEFFYSKPQLVLDVGIRGMLNVLDACLSRDVPELFVASSSEVYQTPPRVPTDETAPFSIPDPLNPRYSYAAGKITSEMLAINYARTHFQRMVIFRPHNVYGPDMGWEHVIPQFVLRLNQLCRGTKGLVRFPILGTGRETRAFVAIDDFTDGLLILLDRGRHREIYNIGTSEEVTIAELAKQTGAYFGREIEIVPGPPAEGATARRCPDIAKLASLGYAPQIGLEKGLPDTARWYVENVRLAPSGNSSSG
jgi:dTDP-glucose 4,6-dehydratase/UDP-glucose 4-epimerase